MNPITIFHINTEKGFRGGEIQSLLLIRELQKRGHQNILIARKSSSLVRRAMESEMAVQELPLRGEWDLLSAAKIRASIRKQNPDILHAHTPHACAMALLARGKNQAPAIVFSRRVTFPVRNKRKFKSVDAFLAVSNPVRDRLLEDGFDSSRIFVAESATDFNQLDQALPSHAAREALQIPESAFVIGYISHFEASKGQRKLIELMPKLSESCILLLGGSGPDFQFCRRLSQRLNLGERVIFAGYRDHIANLYAAMDLFFFPSTHEEGWSGVLREAMGVGLPVIALRRPVAQQQIEHQRTGLLVSESPDQWVQAIRQIQTDHGLRQSISKAAKHEARRYSVEAMAIATEHCYRSVLEKKD